MFIIFDAGQTAKYFRKWAVSVGLVYSSKPTLITVSKSNDIFTYILIKQNKQKKSIF